MASLLVLTSSSFASDPVAAPVVAAPPTYASCAALVDIAAKATCTTALAVELKATQAALVAVGDCTKVAVDAKAACDLKLAEVNAKLATLMPPPVPAKDAKAVKSNTNRMEAETTEE